MTVKIVYLPKATHIQMALPGNHRAAECEAKVMDPEGDQLGALQVMPLVEAVDDLTELAGKIEATILIFENRISAMEAAADSGAAKPTSDFGTQVSAAD